MYLASLFCCTVVVATRTQKLVETTTATTTYKDIHFVAAWINKQ